MIPRERTARTNGTIAHGSRFARQKRLEGQTARGRRHQPQSEAVISGHGRPQPKRRRESGNRDSRTAERPALTIRPSVTDGPPAVVPSTGTSWTGPNGGPWGVRGLGPTTPGIRRDRTWPGQSRKACVSRTGGRAGRRARGGHAEGRALTQVVLSGSGGVLGAGNSRYGGSRGGAARCALPGRAGGGGARQHSLERLASVLYTLESISE